MVIQMNLSLEVMILVPNDGGDGSNKYKCKNKAGIIRGLFSDYLAQLQFQKYL